MCRSISCCSGDTQSTPPNKQPFMDYWKRYDDGRSRRDKLCCSHHENRYLNPLTISKSNCWAFTAFATRELILTSGYMSVICIMYWMVVCNGSVTQCLKDESLNFFLIQCVTAFAVFSLGVLFGSQRLKRAVQMRDFEIEFYKELRLANFNEQLPSSYGYDEAQIGRKLGPAEISCSLQPLEHRRADSLLSLVKRYVSILNKKHVINFLCCVCPCAPRVFDCIHTPMHALKVLIQAFVSNYFLQFVYLMVRDGLDHTMFDPTKMDWISWLCIVPAAIVTAIFQIRYDVITRSIEGSQFHVDDLIAGFLRENPDCKHYDEITELCGDNKNAYYFQKTLSLVPERRAVI